MIKKSINLKFCPNRLSSEDCQSNRLDKRDGSDIAK